jgi:DNA mismatch repair ATPase MutL
MKTIKRLPKDVHSSLRSSIILSDLPRVVEELVYNSIDANASKVLPQLMAKQSACSIFYVVYC